MFDKIAKKLGLKASSKKIRLNWESKNSELVSLINDGRIPEAITLGQELVEFVDREYPSDSPEKATTYNNMGMVFMLDGDYELSEEGFRDAVAMRKRLFGDDHNEVAVIYLNLVELYKRQAREIFMGNKVEA